MKGAAFRAFRSGSFFFTFLFLGFGALVSSSLFAGSRPSAPSNPVPYDADIGPFLLNFPMHYEFPGKYDQISDVNFRELALHVFSPDGTPNWTMQLKHGHRLIRYKIGGFDSIHLDSVYYLPSEDGRQYALVSYTSNNGYASSTASGIAQVFELSAHRLLAIEQLEWDDNFVTSKPYLSFNEKLGRLIIRSAHHLPEDVIWHASAMDVFTLHWEHNHFVKLGMHTEFL